jgi:putative transposase
VPQSLAQILVHVVFSTKNREPILDDAIRTDLHAYIGGIVAHHHGTLLKAGSVCDHVHLLLAHPRTFTPAELIQDMKTGSSKWIKTRENRYRMFHWQAGYGIFSVSASHRPAIESYLERQAEHHRTISFQDEYRSLLRKHGIEWNEDYVWD